MKLKSNSVLIELNAFTWISRLRKKYGPKLTIGSVPVGEWTRLRDQGFDAVWMMGVWKRSPFSVKIALEAADLKAAYSRLLPGWTAADVSGSAYAIADYSLDPFLGKPAELAALHKTLKKLGLRLILDFVPNHLASDHPWTLSHPNRFVRPTPAALKAHPDYFFKNSRGEDLAHGRDPNGGPWIDTVQVNAADPGARKAMRGELNRVAKVCDGVRCDMTMLVLNDVFKKTWGDCLAKDAARTKREFWDDVLGPVKRSQSGFFAIAECYWATEKKLLSLGFDAVYDKSFYDLLAAGEPNRIREALKKPEKYQNKMFRFVENHDEPRTTHAFGTDKALAALAVTFTIPGLKLWHQDQERGWTERVPVQMARFAETPADPDIERASAALLEFTRLPALRDGRWQLLTPTEASSGSTTHQNILSWIWTRADDFALVTVNFSPTPAQARLQLPKTVTRGNNPILLSDLTDAARYERQPQDLAKNGLYVELQPWKYHLLRPAQPL